MGIYIYIFIVARHCLKKVALKMKSTSFSEDEWDIYNSYLKCLHFNFHSNVLDLWPISTDPLLSKVRGVQSECSFLFWNHIHTSLLASMSVSF